MEWQRSLNKLVKKNTRRQSSCSVNTDVLMHYRFWDIPSPWWQASTVLVGVGSALSLLVAITATAACCITYVVHTGTARIAGTLQLIAGQ